MKIRILVQVVLKSDKRMLFTDGEGYEVHKRMAPKIEINLMNSFEKRKDKRCYK